MCRVHRVYRVYRVLTSRICIYAAGCGACDGSHRCYMADHGRLIVECKQSAAAAAAVLTACSVCSDM